MTKCPKCGFQNDLEDDIISSSECPNCGIVFSKYNEAQKKLEAESKKVEAPHLPHLELPNTPNTKGFIISFVIVIVVAILFSFFSSKGLFEN